MADARLTLVAAAAAALGVLVLIAIRPAPAFPQDEQNQGLQQQMPASGGMATPGSMPGRCPDRRCQNHRCRDR